MHILQVMAKRDSKLLPTNDQEYNFAISSASHKYRLMCQQNVSMHDAAVYSLWYHFVAMFTSDNAALLDSNEHYNTFTGKRRLGIFTALAKTTPTPPPLLIKPKGLQATIGKENQGTQQYFAPSALELDDFYDF